MNPSVRAQIAEVERLRTRARTGLAQARAYLCGSVVLMVIYASNSPTLPWMWLPLVVTSACAGLFYNLCDVWLKTIAYCDAALRKLRTGSASKVEGVM